MRGTASLSNATRLPATSSDMNVVPVKLPPGRARLRAMPSATGSPLIAESTVVSCTALVAQIAKPLETMKATRAFTSSSRAARRASRLAGV
jgi:hypothetical protein